MTLRIKHHRRATIIFAPSGETLVFIRHDELPLGAVCLMLEILKKLGVQIEELAE